MSWNAESWPIGAALLQFPGTLADGSSVSDAPATVWARTLQEVRMAGFDYVDLTETWVSTGELERDRLLELGRVLKDVDLGISAISASRRSILDHDPERARANTEYSYRLIEAAETLGVGTVCLGLHQQLLPAQQDAVWFWLAPGAADPDDPEVYRHAVDTFRSLGQHAAERGIQLSLEMYEDTYLGTADQCVQMVKDIGLENVGLNPDVGNIIRLHRPVEHWREQYAKMLPHTNYWHIKNYFRDFDPATGAYATSPAPVEAGYISYREVIGQALELGFAGPICVEHYGGDGLSVAARNRDYIREIIRVKQALAGS